MHCVGSRRIRARALIVTLFFENHQPTRAAQPVIFQFRASEPGLDALFWKKQGSVPCVSRLFVGPSRLGRVNSPQTLSLRRVVCDNSVQTPSLRRVGRDNSPRTPNPRRAGRDNSPRTPSLRRVGRDKWPSAPSVSKPFIASGQRSRAFASGGRSLPGGDHRVQRRRIARPAEVAVGLVSLP